MFPISFIVSANLWIVKGMYLESESVEIWSNIFSDLLCNDTNLSIYLLKRLDSSSLEAFDTSTYSPKIILIIFLIIFSPFYPLSTKV